MNNPFPLNGYHGPDLFCDRDEETATLIEHCLNGVNTVLLSLRRMGKTGLIHHAIHSLRKEKGVSCVYLDIYPSQSLKDLTDAFANSVLDAFPSHNSAGKKLMSLLSSMRPTVTFDPLSGLPQFSFDFSREKDYENSLQSIFSYLENRNATTLIAIDEFQQIGQYPEKNIEALLRSLIQPLKNVRFVFSGSSPHLLNEMFHSSKRPFFSSAQQIYLQPIAPETYHDFITKQFAGHKRQIDSEAVEYILSWSRRHTYYTQAICNKLFSQGVKKITAETVRTQCKLMLKEQEHVFYQYRQLLTPIQWSLLKAIAKEEKVYHATSKAFIGSHDIGTAANVQRAMQALLDKEMTFRQTSEEGSYFSVYDTFLARWLQYQP